MTQATDTRELERRLKAAANYIDDIKARTGANTVMEEGAQKLFREAATTIADLRATVAEAGWRPIETAPRDGTRFIGLLGKRIATVEAGKHYVKWPHQEGGPTYRDVWNEVRPGHILECDPVGWIPIPQPPATAKHGGSNGG